METGNRKLLNPTILDIYTNIKRKIHPTIKSVNEEEYNSEGSEGNAISHLKRTKTKITEWWNRSTKISVIDYKNCMTF